MSKIWLKSLSWAAQSVQADREQRKHKMQSEDAGKSTGSASCILAGEGYQGKKKCEVNAGKLWRKKGKCKSLTQKKGEDKEVWKDGKVPRHGHTPD